MDKELIELLNEYKEKPGLFFGKKALTPLINSIYGYMHCMYKRDKVFPEFLNGFQNFIEKEYDLHKNIKVFRHWSEIILFFNGTEEEAFDEFYIKMEKFLKLSKKQREAIINYSKPCIK